MLNSHKEVEFLLSNLLKKLVIIVIGSIIAAYGITLALYAGFGGVTLAVLWQGIAKTFHLSIGIASFIVALGMILFALIYDKSQIHVGTVLYQIVYSTCVDLFASCHVYSTYRWLNFFVMLLGVLLFAVGTGLYAFVLAEKNNWQGKIVRMALDILVVIIGVLLGGKFGICTIITVIISGPIIQFVNAKAKQIFKI